MMKCFNNDKERVKRIRPKPKICKVRDFNFITNTQRRAGILIYRYKDFKSIKNIEFLFAVDLNSGNLTDFGGGVKKEDFSLLHACFREFKEESYDCFKFKDSNLFENDYVLDSLVIYTKDVFILLLNINFDYDEIREIYMNSYNIKSIEGENCETKDLYLINFNDLRNSVENVDPLIQKPLIYVSIRIILKYCINDIIEKIKINDNLI